MHIAYVTDHFAAFPNGLAQATLRVLAHLRNAGHTVQWLRPANRRKSDPSFGDGNLVAPHAAAVRRAWRQQLPQLVHVATAGPLALAALRAAAAEGIATSADCRSQGGAGLVGGGWAARWELWGLRRLHALADRSFALPAGRVPQWAELGIDAVAGTGRGVDLRAFAPAWHDPWLRQEWHAGTGAPVLLYLGALSRDKNPRLALRAFDRLQQEQPKLRMVVVGDGPLRPALQRDHPRVRFAGVQVGTELARHVASADLLLYPALGDGAGTAVLEALACGLGVVAFDSSAAAAYARDGVSGSLAALNAGQGDAAPATVPDAAVAPGTAAPARKQPRPDADALAEQAFTRALRRALPHAGVGSDMRVAARAAAERHGWDSALRGIEAQLLPAAARAPALPGVERATAQLTGERAAVQAGGVHAAQMPLLVA